MALFQERKVQPHRATDATRWLVVFLGKFFQWRSALVLVKPETLSYALTEGEGNILLALDRQGSSSGRTPDPARRWLTFVRNHAQAIVACDFFVVVTAAFRVL